MKKFLCVILTVLMVASVLGVSSLAGYPRFLVDITNTSEYVYENSTFDVNISITNVTAGTAITCIAFRVNFSTEQFGTAYVQVSENDASRIVSTPNGRLWEQLVTVKDGYYECFFMPEDGGWDAVNDVPLDSVISGDQTLTVALPLTVFETGVFAATSISISNIEAYNAYDASLKTTVDGVGDTYTPSTAAQQYPITTLGAKINTVSPALRLGAKYTPEFLPYGKTSADVTDLGIVFYPTRFLNGAELTCATEGALSEMAKSIDNFDPTKAFVDYEEIVFYVSIVGLPANGYDDEISFRAFYSCGEEIIYSDTLSRSYDYVYETLFPGMATNAGDNVIYPHTGWWD